MSSSEKLLLSVREACRLLSVSERTLWSWRKGGLIPYIQVNRVVRFPRAALEHWIAARQSAGNTAQSDRGQGGRADA